MTVLVAVPAEHVRVGDRIHVSHKIGVRRVADIREYDTLGIEKEQLAELAGASATSSSFSNNLGSLRSLGLIDYPRPGEIAALPVLFLEERA